MRRTIIALSLLLCSALIFAAGTAETTQSQDMDQPVEITMISSPFEKTFPAGYQDDPVMQEIEKRVGIRLHITPANAIADVKAKLASLMATRDLPDLTYVDDANIRKQMISSRLLLNLDDHLDQLNEFEDNRPGSFDRFRNQWSVDIDSNRVDGLYFVGLKGTPGNLYRPKVGFYLRWDLYAQLGYPEINSYDDYIPLIQQMLELEPTNKDGKTNYGISAWFAQAGGFGPWSLNTQFNWDSGVVSQATSNRAFDWDTGEMSPAMTDPDSFFWMSIEWWNKAYRAGIVDPNAFTQKWPDYLENVDKQNRVMMTWADFTILNGEAAFIADGEPEKGFVAMPSPMKDRDTYLVANYQPAGNRSYGVAADSEYPDKAIELLNFLASWESTMLIYNGVQGQTWDIIDGLPQLFDETIMGLSDDSEYVLKTGYNKYGNIAGLGEVDFWPKYDVPAKLAFMPNALSGGLSQVEAAACEYFGVDYPGQIVTKGKSNLFAGQTEQYIAFTALPPADLETEQRNKEIGSLLQEIFFTDMYEAVRAETPAAFAEEKAKIIDHCIAVGGVELYEFHKARYDALK